jgi:hypothetical protein
MPDFTTLDGVFTQFTPADMVGTPAPNLGQDPNVQYQDAFSILQDLLANTGRGVYTAADLKSRLDMLSQASNGSSNFDPSQYIDFYSTQGFVTSLGSNVKASLTYADPTGSPQQIASIYEIVGKDFPAPTTVNPLDVSMIVSRSPFFSPSTRNVRQAEIFLNSMPSTVLAQLVPFLQVEFVQTRSSQNTLQAPGLLKFLLGAVDTTGAASPKTPNDAMISAHQTGGSSPTDGGPPVDEIDYSGMEMFTATQTMLNPQPNQSVGSSGVRYTDVIDPFRPFATLEHATIKTVGQKAGCYTYRTAEVQIKIHDRGRISEMAELIKPDLYPTVTVWLTYGWRAPVRPGDNPYFDFVNNNMLVREAYGVQNSHFSFDQVGQMTVTLQLYTKGVNEMRTSKISDNSNDLQFQFQSLRKVGELIAKFRRDYNLSPTDGSNSILGLNKDIRAFQVLDAAEQGVMPTNISNISDILSGVTQLRNILLHTKGINSADVNTLITTLTDYYKNSKTDATTKMNLPDNLASRVTDTVLAMFTECITGPDPFLPDAVKSGVNQSTIASDLSQALAQYNQAPKSPSSSTFRKTAVSFGKIFTVFAMRNLISADTVDELQVFFYPINEQCGPISSQSIAAFPIDMQMFLDQYRDHVVRTGGERMTLEDFLSLIIDAQILDERAIGYGMRPGYKPWDPKNPEAKQVDNSGSKNSFMGQWQAKYGAFQKPAVKMYIEVSHQRSSDAGQADILNYITYSAINADTQAPAGAQSMASKRIMRIHIYDEVTNPYKPVGLLLRDTTGLGYIQAPATDTAQMSSADAAKYNQQLAQAINNISGDGSPATYDDATGLLKFTDPPNNQQIKDIASKMVPTIRYGCNGSTVTNAALQSHADPLMSTNNMLATMTQDNAGHPNGSGFGMGIPLRVVPATLNLTSLGNPLAMVAQKYFIDFQTGTSLDNLYTCIGGLTHTIGPGKFETQWVFAFADAYGVFEHPVSIQDFISNLAASVPGAPST